MLTQPAASSNQTLDKLTVVDEFAARSYLVNKTQHLIGGFGKTPGDAPDIYHSYLGLAALSILNHPDIEPIHAAACISVRAVEYLESAIRSGFR
jgi:geranylgeranyl transferase type-1 subunit beta